MSTHVASAYDGRVSDLILQAQSVCLRVGIVVVRGYITRIIETWIAPRRKAGKKNGAGSRTGKRPTGRLAGASDHAGIGYRGGLSGVQEWICEFRVGIDCVAGTHYQLLVEVWIPGKSQPGLEIVVDRLHIGHGAHGKWKALVPKCGSWVGF